MNLQNTEIVVEKTSESSNHDDLISDFPETECRWAVQNYEYEEESGGKANKIVFYTW